ncbi:MAG: hypothetical protein ACRDYV_01345 [Acidimicrobiia bacterium]
MDTDHSPLRSRRLAPGIALFALAAGLVAGGLGIAGAAEKPESETIEVPRIAPFPGPDAVFWKHRRGIAFGPGGPGFGFGPGGGIHSEVTFENGEGRYATTATQLGKVVSVSPTSITLESDDGYQRTYAVNEDTVVTAGRDGIANLEKGDTVHLYAEVEGKEARARQILDGAAMKFELGRALPGFGVSGEKQFEPGD